MSVGKVNKVVTRVSVTLVVSSVNRWQENCTLGQIYRDGERCATARLRQLLDGITDVRLDGPIKVEHVIAEVES